MQATSSPKEANKRKLDSSSEASRANPTATAAESQKHNQPLIKVRLINVDHVCSTPTLHDRTDCAFLPPGEHLKKVPVLRIFGATPNGQRVCLHLHGVFPYCYIPYEGDLNPDRVLLYISKLGQELNAAITASLRGNPAAPESYQHLAAIHLVKGVPFYGYHVGWRYYLKISFVDPSHNFRLATILQSGRVMQTAFQPHEIHIRYQLQFMLDYNIFGCDYIDIEQAHFRLPVPGIQNSNSSFESNQNRWDEASIPAHLIQNQEVHRTSFCDIEIDASAKHVINRRRLKPRSVHHDFDEDDRLGTNQKLVPSLTGLWEEEAARRLKAGLSPTPPPPDPSKDVRALEEGQSPVWMAEPRYRQLLEARIALDRQQGPKRPRHFTQPHPLDPHISTTFDSVEFFHYTPEELADINSGSSLHSRDGHTQLPSTLYNLENHSTQASQKAAGASSGEAASPSSLDTTFFGTQAFQQDLEELERRQTTVYDSEGDSDHEVDAVEASDAKVPESPAAPRTPKKQRVDGPSTENAETPSSQRNKAVPTTPLLRSALKTPGRTMPGHESGVRFLSPVRSEESRDRTPFSQPNSISTGTPVQGTPAPPSTQTGLASSPSAPSTGASQASVSSGPPLLSPEWISAHIRAQTRWRESAHTQYRAARPDDASKSVKVDRMHSTVLALTQLGTASSHGSRSDAQETFPSSSGTKGQEVSSSRMFSYFIPPPSRVEVTESLPLFGLPPVEYQDPYYSNPADVPTQAREYAGRSWRFSSKTIKFLPDFPNAFASNNRSLMQDVKGAPLSVAGEPVKVWEYGLPPPPRRRVAEWVRSQKRKRKKLLRKLEKQAHATQSGSGHQRSATQAGSFGFKVSQRQPGGQKPVPEREKQHMTVFAIEVHVNTRGRLLPDPKKDAIQVIAYSFQNEDESLDDTGSRPGLRTGLIIFEESNSRFRADRMGLAHLPVALVDTELDMFNQLVDVVRELDPEILVGYEIHNASWGYVIDRARQHLGYDLVPELSRVNNQSTGTAGGKSDSWGWTQTSALKVTGRHILNIWRLMRGELNLNQYTYENVVFHLLRSRVPRFPHDQLTQWYTSGRPQHISRVIKYFIERVETDLFILDTSELVFRTAEFARIYGIDFFSVISRGSQFKVESVMFRISKPESFLLPSPNTKQVAEQNAAECLPLILEPQSAFYKGPLLVLDFQSLYPSVMIAYNICYSTCLGRVSKFQGTDKFGITELSLPQGLLTLLKDDINISANGLVYVKPHVRRSLLAKMLTEILDTRVMIKGSMKGRKKDKAFMRIQNARQLSLKLLANVTYGYTSATFSGRMPCVEIADSIVQYGRETLEKAIELIHATSRWGAQVVYGDTDSLFIYLPDRSKEEAFRIGNEIASAVTARNPKPVKLKFEKVYLPSVLLAKKRYVGFKYEAPDEEVPDFNAKGIETVRRDGFPALQKMLESCIRILFTTQDLSLVKSYCQRQWRSILTGTVSVHDFIIAKEVRLGGYSENGVPPPGAAVSTRRMLLDARAEPQHAERVPYIITQGEPKAKLNDLAVEPGTMLANPLLQLNALYYIQRGIIPPLSRVFNLLGADVEQWFREMPRPSNVNVHDDDFDFAAGAAAAASSSTSPSGVFNSPTKRAAAARALTLTGHYRRNVCLSCSRPLPAQQQQQQQQQDDATRSTGANICVDCVSAPSSTMLSVAVAHTTAARRLEAVEDVCAHCSLLSRGDGGTLTPASGSSAVSAAGVGLGSSSGSGSPCVSWDCPVLYERQKIRLNEVRQRNRLAKVQIAVERAMDNNDQ